MPETTNTSATPIRRSSTPRKKKKSQIPIALIVLVLIIGVGILLGLHNSTMALYWGFGCCFGFILQKSRFCFTASLRDPCITGSTSVTRAVLIAFAITTIKYGSFITDGTIPGQSYVMPMSFATALGGILFGIGMVIAGGCASGTLMRVGEGFSMQMLSLVFFIIGSLVGANHMGFWELNFNATAPRVFLPDIFGWFGAVVVQLLVILLLYIAADKYEKKKMGITDEE